MYYIAKNCLRWDDSDFWESSPKFLFKQFDLYVKYNKPPNENKKGNVNRTEIKKEKKKYKVLDSIGGD